MEQSYNEGDRLERAIVELLRRHGLPALDNQLHLQKLVGEADWALDQDAGTITLGELVCQMSILGSQSSSDGSWLWSWSNSSVRKALTTDAAAIRSYGEHYGVEAFTQARIPLVGGITTPEVLGMLGSELRRADAYYRAPVPAGVLIALLRLPDDAPRPREGDAVRAFRTLAAAPMALPVAVDRAMVEAYLRSCRVSFSTAGPELVLDATAQQSVTVRFDSRDRLADLRSRIQMPDK